MAAIQIPRSVVAVLMLVLGSAAAAAETLTFDAPECAGMSGLRAHWDRPITVAEDGARKQVDAVVKDRGQTAIWDGDKPGPLAFDAVHRSLLVRFPEAAEKIAAAVAKGKSITKVELVLPYIDEELWPLGPGGADYPSPDGYRYRTNWDCDRLYREQRPHWHAVAHVLRRPWAADPAVGPTFNAAVNGKVFWSRFGASDIAADRFPNQLGPAEVSSYAPDGRMDVTAVVADDEYGATLGQRLRLLSDCGFIIQKQEMYDARYYQGAYEWAISTGPRAILVKRPHLVVTLGEGKAEKVALPPKANVASLAGRPKAVGAATAFVPTAAEVAKLDRKFLAKPAWMADWQYDRVRQLMALETGGVLRPFYYRVLPPHVINRVREVTEREAKATGKPADVDYATYLAWVDWVNGQPPRFWEGHLTAADTITRWYNYREAMPAAMQASVVRSWTAWLMPERETETDAQARRRFDDTSGRLIHPMADDPRVGKSKDGKPAEWNQGDTYVKLTGDWRGNKSYYRSGFTRDISTANFNSSATSGALLCGQIIGSKNAMADGRAGLMQFPFWMWTHSAGVGQEYVDHYYWAIATAGNKVFPDFCAEAEDRMAGWSIIEKTVNDLAGAYHPNLKKLIGPASRTYSEHVLGVQDGLYHILHVLSPKGALSDVETGVLPALTVAADAKGNQPKPISAWGHDYPAATVALQSMSGPWSAPWFAELVDEKPLPWSLVVEKKVVADGDWVTSYFGEHYGLSSIRLTPQRIHVLGHWRRKPELPKSMRDIGTLDMRIGFNQTTIGNDGSGVITEQGKYRCYQQGPRLIMLAKPQPDVIKQRAGEYQFGQRKLPAEAITSVQCTAALFSYEAPQPTWEIFVDDKKISSLPATAKAGQVITIRDGVTYLALRPLPTTDLGRDEDITLEAGQPQTQAYHEQTNIQPALLVHANVYRRKAPLPQDALAKLGDSTGGFVVEMGDEKDYGSFAKFQAHVRGATLAAGDAGGVSYTSGPDTFAASWVSFTVNGKDPHACLKERNLWQDTTLTQMGRGRLEKNGAVVDRGAAHPELNMFLQTFPKQKVFVASNLLPNYLAYSFQEPGGVRIEADGRLSMGRWAVKDSREIDVVYHAFGGTYLPNEGGLPPARALFVSGAKSKPRVTLNGKDVSAKIQPSRHDGVDGWLVPLGDSLPPAAEIAAGLAAAREAVKQP